MNDDDRRMIREAHQVAAAFAILVCERDDALRELGACSSAAADADREWRKAVAELTVELSKARAATSAADAVGEPDADPLPRPMTDEELRAEVAREIAYAMGEGEAFDQGHRNVYVRAAIAAMRPTMAEVVLLRRRVDQVMAAHVRDLESWRATLEAEQAGEQAHLIFTTFGGKDAGAEVSAGAADVDERQEGRAVAVGPEAMVVGPAAAAHMVAALAAGPFTPFTGGCPNTPPCEHKNSDHGGDALGDPMPTCWGDGCRCGQPPAGWRRVADQRVWNNGDTIPAGVKVLALDGAVHPFGITSEWVNASLGPVVEVELIEHKHVGGSAGVPGECSARCSCDTTFDGFDTVQDALVHLNQHIENERQAAARATGEVAVDA